MALCLCNWRIWAERDFFGFIPPPGVEWEMSIFFDAGGLISRVSAKKKVGYFFRLFACFCAFLGVFLCFFPFFFSAR